MLKLDLGNNESVSQGIVDNNDGTFLALTFTQSRQFKTVKGAERWLARMTATSQKVHVRKHLDAWGFRQ